MKLAALATLSFLSIAACGGGSAARPASAPVTTAKTPPPPAQAQKLTGMLVGTWKGAGTITMQGQTGPVQVELTCAETASAWGVTCNASAVDPSGARHDETHLWGYSADGAKVHFFAVTTDGDTHDHAGTFTDKGVAVRYEGTMEGKPYVEAITVDSDGPASFRLRNQATLADSPLMALDVTFKK